MQPIIDRRNLILPRELPNGSVQWEEHTDIGVKVRDGDPTLGWEGDASLSLVYVSDYEAEGYRGPAWQVWQRLGNGEATVLCTRKGQRAPGLELIQHLAASDTHHVDVVVKVAQANAKHEADQRAALSESNMDKADKLAWALGRDLDMPAQDGRIYPVSG